MAKNTHLTLDERIEIEGSLNERKSFKTIARNLGKDPTTISKEVRNHLIPERPHLYNPCGIIRNAGSIQIIQIEVHA